MMKMKKLIAIVVASVSSISVVSAQQAFKSLAIGFEAGTTGLGVEIAIPVVTDRIVLKGGLTAPSLTYPFSFNADMQIVNDEIASANNYLSQVGAEDRINTRFSDLSLTATPTLNLSTARLLVELYPFKRSSFHITVGAYLGMGDKFLSASLQSDEVFVSELNSLRAEVESINEKYSSLPGYSPVDVTASSFNFNGTTYMVREAGGKATIDAELEVAKFRPYLGIGFGRSMPKGHLGFQFDMGLWYHGSMSLVSDNEVTFDPAAPDVTPDITGLENIDFQKVLMFYPHVALRLIYKIF